MAYKGFTQVELRKPSRSTFDLSHEKRVTSRMGVLTPVFITETIPNDTFRVSTEVLIKLAPMIAPIFHRVNMYVHFFFVPQRLLWEDWEEMITGGRLGTSVSVPPAPPTLEINSLLQVGQSLLDVGSLADYLGVPPIPDADVDDWTTQELDARPFAAVLRIWYDYYRDRNFSADPSGIFPLESGVISDGTVRGLLTAKQYRCWEHEYFSSALPFTQRGAEVLMPLEGSGVVTYQPVSTFLRADGNNPSSGNVLTDGFGLMQDVTNHPAHVENIDEVLLDSSNVSINDFRKAMALQQWMERNALGGSRINETIMAHFARRTSDARLQRAEYLGGGKAVVQVSEVLTTAYSEDADAATVPPGNMAGKGSAYSQVNGFTYNCEEWGFIVGVLSVMPTSAYMQGLPRMFFNRRSQLDYPWPAFAHLGEQEVFDVELFVDPDNMPNTGGDTSIWPLFGYQSRYADWKSIPSSSHGDFRTSLDFWHLTRKFDVTPNLDAAFVTFEAELQDRVFNVSGVDTLWMYIYNKVTCTRSLPYFGTPSL